MSKDVVIIRGVTLGPDEATDVLDEELLETEEVKHLSRESKIEISDSNE